MKLHLAGTYSSLAVASEVERHRPVSNDDTHDCTDCTTDDDDDCRSYNVAFRCYNSPYCYSDRTQMEYMAGTLDRQDHSDDIRMTMGIQVVLAWQILALWQRSHQRAMVVC